jgi:large subunit ribosomal protein L1
MKKRGKRYNQLLKNYDPKSAYPYKEAIEIVKKNATAKFDESFEVAMRLGVDPRKADQLVRGTVTLPHGTGRKVRVLVLCKSPRDKEALEAGADYAGFEEYIEKIKGGWTDVDVIIATPMLWAKLVNWEKFLDLVG